MNRKKRKKKRLQRTNTTDYDRLTLEEKKVLLFLLENEKVSRKDVVNLLGVKETKAKEIFNILINKKLIERKGKGRSTYYVLQMSKGETG